MDVGILGEWVVWNVWVVGNMMVGEKWKKKSL